MEQCDKLSRTPSELAGWKEQKVYEGAVALSSLGGGSPEFIKEKDNELLVWRPYTADIVDGKGIDGVS